MAHYRPIGQKVKSQMSTSSANTENQNTNSQLAIGKNKYKPIANSQLVDTLLNDYAELIDPLYMKWFAKHFYRLTPGIIQRCASEARADGKDCRRLFAFLIKKNVRKYARPSL